MIALDPRILDVFFDKLHSAYVRIYSWKKDVFNNLAYRLGVFQTPTSYLTFIAPIFQFGRGAKQAPRGPGPRKPPISLAHWVGQTAQQLPRN